MSNLKQIPNKIVGGFDKKGKCLFHLPLKDEFDENKTYRLIYEIQNFEGEKLYPKRVDFTFSGKEILNSLIKIYSLCFDHTKSKSLEDTIFEFRHFVKRMTTVYTYLKIKGDTPSVRRELRDVFGTTTKEIKYLLKNRDFLFDCIKSYHYTKISDKNTVILKDVESMSDEEVQKYVDNMDWSKQTNLHKMYMSKEEWVDTLKRGVIKIEHFNSDLSNIETVH